MFVVREAHDYAIDALISSFLTEVAVREVAEGSQRSYQSKDRANEASFGSRSAHCVIRTCSRVRHRTRAVRRVRDRVAMIATRTRQQEMTIGSHTHGVSVPLRSSDPRAELSAISSQTPPG